MREIPGKGKGIVATTKIPKGTRILAESPLFIVQKKQPNPQVAGVDICREIERLSDKQKQDFFALHNSHENRHIPELGICKTNALPLGSDATEGGLFLQASRINHSCRHNAQNTWNERLNKITIHGFRDIEEGEEITISYLSESSKYADRQIRLESAFGFRCSCELCIMPSGHRLQSDERLSKIESLDRKIGDGRSIISTPLASLCAARSLLQLLEEEGIADARVPRVYYDAFQIAIANGDQARARVLAQRAKDAWVILQGDDGPDATLLGKYADSPASHRLFGTADKWKQAVAKVPRELNAQDFESWLWKLRR
ncbi:hypothetical protein V2A60_008774 [Cordyceps javanica]